MIGLFEESSSLTNLPDISNWDTSNVVDMSRIFSQCSSLTSLPDISKWDTSKVINMIGMFSHCFSLKSIPNFSYWNFEKLENMSYMFSECKSLPLDISHISEWKFKKGIKMKGIFKGSPFKEIPSNILDACSEWLHPGALKGCIYPELIRFLFDN